jgi:serine phosphatase RsbU (regulator of sigma subunit)
LTGEVRDYLVNIDRAGNLALPGELSDDLVQLRPAQLAYGRQALSLTDRAPVPSGAVSSQLASFRRQFEHLRTAGAAVTEELAEAQRAGEADVDAAQRRAEHRIVTAAGLALGGLLAVSAALAVMGRRLAAALLRERSIAETLQRNISPDRLPERAGLRMAARFIPKDRRVEVGGDWYDAIDLPGGALGLVIGDVTGHDVVAASTMGQLRNAVRAWSLTDPSPSEMLSRLNRLLFAFAPEHMATCIYLRLSEARDDAGLSQTVTVEAANAGHCPPLVILPSGVVRLIEAAPCPPLGAVPGSAYPQQKHVIERGSTLLLYTDGLVERRDSGLERGTQLLIEAAHTVAAGGPVDPEVLCEHVSRQLLTDGSADDDVALLAVTFDGRDIVADGPPANVRRPGGDDGRYSRDGGARPYGGAAPSGGGGG